MCSNCKFCKTNNSFTRSNHFCILNQCFVFLTDSCDLFKDVNSDDDDFISSESDDIDFL